MRDKLIPFQRLLELREINKCRKENGLKPIKEIPSFSSYLEKKVRIRGRWD